MRDPIARNLSLFFQAYEYHAGMAYPNSNTSLEKLIELFFDGLIHDMPLQWFNEEFKATLGIDVYDYPFPNDKQYTIIKEGNFELLILKIETSDEIKAQGLGEFFGISDFTLYHHNIAEDKRYADTYKQFKYHIQIPDEDIDRMYNSQYMQHFYTEAEQATFRSQWSKAPTA